VSGLVDRSVSVETVVARTPSAITFSRVGIGQDTGSAVTASHFFAEQRPSSKALSEKD